VHQSSPRSQSSPGQVHRCPCQPRCHTSPACQRLVPRLEPRPRFLPGWYGPPRRSRQSGRRLSYPPHPGASSPAACICTSTASRRPTSPPSSPATMKAGDNPASTSVRTRGRGAHLACRAMSRSALLATASASSHPTMTSAARISAMSEPGHDQGTSSARPGWLEVFHDNTNRHYRRCPSLATTVRASAGTSPAGSPARCSTPRGTRRTARAGLRPFGAPRHRAWPVQRRSEPRAIERPQIERSQEVHLHLHGVSPEDSLPPSGTCKDTQATDGHHPQPHRGRCRASAQVAAPVPWDYVSEGGLHPKPNAC
jgi:hypothetical protein